MLRGAIRLPRNLEYPGTTSGPGNRTAKRAGDAPARRARARPAPRRTPAPGRGGARSRRRSRRSSHARTVAPRRTTPRYKI